MRGTLAGAFSACLGLIVLHAVASSGGSGRIREAFRDANAVLERVLDPKVPAIPDLRTGAAAGVGDTGVVDSTVADGRGYVRTPSAAAPTTGPAKFNLGGYSANPQKPL